MRRALHILLSLALLCPVSLGCGTQRAVSSTPSLDKITERGVLLVGTTGDYRPLSYKEPETGEYLGGGIDIAGEIAESIGVSISYVPTSWPTLSADVKNPGGLNEKFARENLPLCNLIVFEKNEEIPSKVAEGEADVIITEITEAPWYVQNDSRLAAPLIDHPFTRGEIGVLMRKGQKDLLNAVNKSIDKMKTVGSLKHLHEKYGLVYRY